MNDYFLSMEQNFKVKNLDSTFGKILCKKIFNFNQLSDLYIVKLYVQNIHSFIHKLHLLSNEYDFFKSEQYISSNVKRTAIYKTKKKKKNELHNLFNKTKKKKSETFVCLHTAG